MSIKMVSKKAHRYGTRRMVAGDEFDVPGQSDKRLLEAMGWAEAAKPRAKPEEPVTTSWAPIRTYGAAKKVAAKTAAKKTSSGYGTRSLTPDADTSDDD